MVIINKRENTPNKFLELSQILIFLFICLSGSAFHGWASSDNDNVYMPGNKWDNKIKTNIEILDSFVNDQSEIENDDDFRAQVESNFCELLGRYKNLDFSQDPSGKKKEIAVKLREYEAGLSNFYSNDRFYAEDLWDFEYDLECSDEIKHGKSVKVIENPWLPPKFFRLPSSFEGEKFLIGGERNNFEDRQDIYMLNFDIDKCPDILADAKEHASYVCIPDHKFSTIEFEHVSNEILLNEEVLRECARILNPEGTFTFKTQHDSNEFYEQDIPEEITKAKDNLASLYHDVHRELQEDDHWESPNERFYYLFTAQGKKEN